MLQIFVDARGKSFVILVTLILCSTLYGDDRWPQFRGPDGQGHSTQTDVPVQFDLEHGVRWRTPIEGKGWSSPVVADGQVWLTTAVSTAASAEETEKKLANVEFKDIKEVASSVTFLAVCVDFASGKIIHRIELATTTDPQPINPLNTFASPTPVLDGGRVYCHFGNYGTWCLDSKSGKTIWHEQIEVEYSVGPGSSPILCDDLLIVVCDGCDQQFVLALDKATGQTVWKTPRPALRADSVEFKKSFCTPLVIEVDGKKQIVVPGAQWIAAYEPASGLEIWRIDHGDGFSLCAAPLFSHGLVIFSTGYGKPDLVAVRPEGHGDVSSTHVAWRTTRGAPNKPSPIIVGDELYMLADNGVLTQLRIADGSEVWRQRLGAEYSASPVAAGDKIYFLAHDGTVSVVQASPTFQLLAENKLESRLMASPAIVGKDLLIRSEQALLRIGN